MLILSRLQESLREHQMTRYCLQEKEDPHGPSVSLFIGNLPTGLAQRQYEKILLDIIGKGQLSQTHTQHYLKSVISQRSTLSDTRNTT